MPDFNLAHQFRIINERFVNNHEESVPQNVRHELNNKRVLKLDNFYYYALIVFSLLMVRFFICFLFVGLPLPITRGNKISRDSLYRMMQL